MIERVSSRGAGRLVKISLRDVPLKTRRRSASYIYASYARDGDILSAVELERAVLFPSDRTYLIPLSMVEEVLGAAPNGQGRKLTRVELPERMWNIYDGWADD